MAADITRDGWWQWWLVLRLARLYCSECSGVLYADNRRLDFLIPILLYVPHYS